MPARGGRYPVGAHDRPLRWRLCIGGDSLRQGFFARESAWPPCRRPPALRLFHPRQNEPIPTLAADGLKGGCLDAGVRFQELERTPRALDIDVAGGLADDPSPAHDVVEDDDRSRP